MDESYQNGKKGYKLYNMPVVPRIGETWIDEGKTYKVYEVEYQLLNRTSASNYEYDINIYCKLPTLTN